MEYKKNTKLEVTITDMGMQGEGIGKVDGYTLFVKDAMVGDTIEALITKPKKNYAYARCEKVLKPSPFRIEPVCKLHKKCGGCQLMAMDYKKQLMLKTDKVKNNLIRLGGFDADFVDRVTEPIIGMDDPYRYRNKAQYPIGTDKEGNPIAGFYAGRTHSIIANTDCHLEHSCNDAIVQMSELMDTNTFLGYIKKFGFGERTGVELPSETRGSVKNQNDKYWSGRSKATMSIGQEMSASAIQMVQAATVLANRGVMVKLSFIEKIEDNDGTISYHHETKYGERVLKPATADYILSCMETTAQSGTGTKASLGDISIGVKTGTAQMLDKKNGGYSKEDFVSNCLAIFPVEDPQVILYIVITKAKGENYAGRIVAPVIGEAADTIIDQLGISRLNAKTIDHSGIIEIPGTKKIEIKSTVPDFRGMSLKAIYSLLDRQDINLVINGSGWVVSQNPAPGTPVTEGMTIELNLK